MTLHSSGRKGEQIMTELQLSALRNAVAAGAQINMLGDFVLRNYKEPERVKEPLEGIRRLTEELLKDVEKL